MEDDESLYDGHYEEGGEVFDYKISDLNGVTERIQNTINSLDKLQLIKVGKEEIEEDVQQTKELSSKLRNLVEKLTLDELFPEPPEVNEDGDEQTEKDKDKVIDVLAHQNKETDIEVVKEEVEHEDTHAKSDEPNEEIQHQEHTLHNPEPTPQLPKVITSVTQELSLPKLKPTTIQSMLFLSNRKQFITGTSEGDISLYNITATQCTLQCETYLGSKNKEKKSDINFIYEINSSTLACATSLNKVFIVSVTDTSLNKINKLKGHTDIVISVIALDNTTVISSSYDRSIKLFKNIFDRETTLISIKEPNTIREAIALVKISDTAFVANWKYPNRSELTLYSSNGEVLDKFDSTCKGCVASNGLFFIPKATTRKHSNEHLAIGYDDENSKGEIILVDLVTKAVTVIADADNVIRCFEPMCFALYNEEYLLHSQNGTFSQIDLDGGAVVKYFKQPYMFMGKLLGVLPSSEVIVVDNEEKELIDQNRGRFKVYPGITTYKLTFNCK